MSNIRWIGAGQDTKQINAVTPANVAIGNVFTVTLNGKAYSFTATANTVANVTAGLQALLAASVEGEFLEETWVDNTTALGATATTFGKPFTQSSGATGGTATLVTSTPTANASRNDVNTAVNWTGGIPSSDNVYVDGASVSLLYSLSALSAVTFTSLTISNTFTGTMGLPETNTDGTAYHEYRPTYFAVGTTTLNVGDFTGTGSGRIKIDNGSVQAAVNVYNTGSPAESDKPAFLWKGTHASNVMRVEAGSVGVAFFGAEAATLATLTIVGGSVVCGAGTTLTTVNLSAGTLDTAGAVGGTITMEGGVWTHRAGNIATLNLNNGRLQLFNTAALTITTLVIGQGGVLDLTNATGAVTLSSVTIRSGGTIIDPSNKIATTFTYTAQNGPNSANVARGGASATVAIS